MSTSGARILFCAPLACIARLASNLFRNLAALALALCALLIGGVDRARALPVSGNYVDDSRCDAVPNQTLGHEIGETTGFPIDERISAVVSNVMHWAWVADDGFPNDFTVQ